MTLLLTSGGHNAGIVAGPVHPKRHYRMRTRRLVDPHLAPDDWLAAAHKHEGSWWPAWQAWLASHSAAQVSLRPWGVQSTVTVVRKLPVTRPDACRSCASRSH